VKLPSKHAAKLTSKLPSTKNTCPQKICIAGTLSDTINYQNALSSVGLAWEVPVWDIEQHIVTDSDTDDPVNLKSYAGLLLPGGGDLPQSITNASLSDLKNQSNPCSMDAYILSSLCPLDRWQLKLLHHFVLQNKPILGICKGMQLINLYFHGTLYQDLFCAHAHRWDPLLEKDQFHITYALPNTFLWNLYGKHFQTNSAHHQGCALLGTGLLPAQYSDDCVMEAFYHVTLPIMGVQWHPERMSLSFHISDMIDGSLLFSYFRSLCY